MPTKILIISIIFLSAFFVPQISYSQDAPKSNRKANKELVKQRKDKGKDARKSDKEAIDSHYKSQDKATRKRMKRNQKKTIKLKKNRKPPFWKRWFR